MCCSTGLCGVSVDPDLLRISTVISNLQKHGIKVQRFNLSNYPSEFVKNTAINQLMEQQGVEVLPITVLDDKILKTGKYPTNEELAGWLGITLDTLGSVASTNKVLIKSSKTIGKSDDELKSK